MRKVLKTVDNSRQKFIPPNQGDDLREDAASIKDRPLVVMHRKLTREDRLNMRGLSDIEEKGGLVVATNIGTIARYIWENAVDEVLNVLTNEGEFESVKGKQKDALFNTEGIDLEIMETVRHIQEVSSFSEDESKNS